jgi:hypothetical protein
LYRYWLNRLNLHHYRQGHLWQWYRLWLWLWKSHSELSDGWECYFAHICFLFSCCLGVKVVVRLPFPYIKNRLLHNEITANTKKGERQLSGIHHTRRLGEGRGDGQGLRWEALISYRNPSTSSYVYSPRPMRHCTKS